VSCPPRRNSYALLGDSFAEGLAPYLGPAVDACGDSLRVDAVRGSGIEYWTPERVLTAAGQAEVVMLSIGGNDFDKAPGSVGAPASQVATALAKAGKTLLWIPPVRLPQEDRARAREAWARAAPKHVKWDLIFDPPRTADGVHPTPAGYRTWAKAIWAWVSRGGYQSAASLPLPALALAGAVVLAFFWRNRRLT
jgi:lysophospholipase L1-like esterase